MTKTTSLFNQTNFGVTCTSTFQKFYGIGRVRASRLSAFLLNHPEQMVFNRSFDSLLYSELVRTLPEILLIDRPLRFYVAHCLRDKILVFCYSMFRLFQGLPGRGQRTRANGRTPRNYNPYIAVGVNYYFYPALEIAYKRRELKHNDRFDELKAYDAHIAEQEKLKEEKGNKAKAAKEAFIREQKTK